MKSKFKDTKIGKLIKSKAPQVLDLVGDLLPDKGVTGVVKRLIDRDDTVSDADTQMLHREVERYEIEAFELEVKDRGDARDLYKSDSVLQKVFAVVFLTGYICVTLLLLFGVYQSAISKIEYRNEEVAIVTMVFTAMSTKVGTVTDFLFGGSVK
jgi:hypothetical protein